MLVRRMIAIPVWKVCRMADSAEGKLWQIWLPVLAGLVIGLAGIGAGTYVSVATIESQREQTEFQVTFLDKKQAYTVTLEAVRDAFDAVSADDPRALLAAQDKLEDAFVRIEPYLKESDRQLLWGDVQAFDLATGNMIMTGEDGDLVAAKFDDFRMGFRDRLVPLLFDD